MISRNLVLDLYRSRKADSGVKTCEVFAILYQDVAESANIKNLGRYLRKSEIVKPNEGIYS